MAGAEHCKILCRPAGVISGMYVEDAHVERAGFKSQVALAGIETKIDEVDQDQN